jgi:hypothetical protein
MPGKNKMVWTKRRVKEKEANCWATEEKKTRGTAATSAAGTSIAYSLFRI